MKLLLTSLIGLCMLGLPACDGVDFSVGDGSNQDDDTSTTAPTIVTYGGIGSFWTMTKDANTFTITKQEERKLPVIGTVTGTWTKTPSGFIQLIVESGTGVFAGAEGGETAYGVEIPGSLFVLKAPGDNKIIYMPALGECPSEDLILNGLSAETGRTLVYNDDILSHAQIDLDVEASTGAVDARSFGDNVSETADNSEFAYSCSGGEIIIGNGNKMQDGVLADSGLGYVNDVLLLPQDAKITAADVGGNYVGLVYGPTVNNENQSVQPVLIEFDGETLTGIANTYPDVDQIDTPNDTISLAVANYPAGSIPGAFAFSTAGDVTNTSQGLGTLMAVRNLGGSGKTFIAAFGQTPESEDPYFVFGISSD